MTLRGEGRAHGAITVVNAIPSGFGAAIGITLATAAEVRLEERPGQVAVTIAGAAQEDPKLARACIEGVAERFGGALSGTVETRSDIPIARGLKSSSAAANAIVLAALDALGERPSAREVLQLSVAAARRAGVTATGALDDAAASLLGGIVVTDNRRDRVLERKPLQRDHHVLMLVPRHKRYTRDSVAALGPLAPLSQRWFALARGGRWEEALTLNGLGVAATLGEPLDPAYRALGAGASAAGMSGTGPATAAVSDLGTTLAVRRAWSMYEADVLQAETTNEGVLP